MCHYKNRQPHGAFLIYNRFVSRCFYRSKEDSNTAPLQAMKKIVLLLAIDQIICGFVGLWVCGTTRTLLVSILFAKMNEKLGGYLFAISAHIIFV
jgi:hypothetical protein